VNGAKEFIDLLRIVVAFQRNKAIADDLEVLFRFRLEEFKDLVRHFFVQRQRVKVGARRCSGNGPIELLHNESLTHFRLGKIQWRWFRWKREAIALLENGDIIDTLFACVADFQKNRFQQRNSIRKEFRQRPVEITAGVAFSAY